MSKKTWLWIGVAGFGGAIFILWIWALRIQLSLFTWQKTPENYLLKNSQNEWNQLFNSTEEIIKRETAKAQIKNIIEEVLSQAKSTSSAMSETTTSSIGY